MKHATGQAARPEPGPDTVTFSETMRGHLLLGELNHDGPRITVDDLKQPDRRENPLAAGLGDYRVEQFLSAAAAGSRHRCMTEMTITYPTGLLEARTSTFCDRHELPPGHIYGVATIPGLGDGRFAINGSFYMARRNPAEADVDLMMYICRLRDQDDDTYDWFGFKVLRGGTLAGGWRATTTLYTTIFKAGEQHRCRALGVMLVSPIDAARLAQTLVGRNLRRPGGIARVVRGFERPVSYHYITPLQRTRGLDRRPKHVGSSSRSLPGADQVLFLRGANHWDDGGEDLDSVRLRLTMYEPSGDKPRRNHPVLLTHGYGMSTRAFAWPFDENNEGPGPTSLVGHLRAEGYQVWLMDNRGSIDLPSSRSDFNLDDIARIDWPKAVDKVRERTGVRVHAFGHCVGSATLLMALLSRLEGVQTATCSQFLTHLNTSSWDVAKAEIHLGRFLEGARVKFLNKETGVVKFDRAFDALYRMAPVPDGERCGLAVCHWINAIYGLTHTHSQLDERAHEALTELFGPAAVPGLTHLQVMVRARQIVDHRGNDVYLGDARTGKIAVPMHIVYGEKNYIFHPSGEQKALAWLRRTFDGIDSNLTVTALPDYAHLDVIIGRRAHVEVFPAVSTFLNEHDRDEACADGSTVDRAACEPTQIRATPL
jgi:cholesterol oxidase